jgi:hypothetical protein
MIRWPTVIIGIITQTAGFRDIDIKVEYMPPVSFFHSPEKVMNLVLFRK